MFDNIVMYSVYNSIILSKNIKYFDTCFLNIKLLVKIQVSTY